MTITQLHKGVNYLSANTSALHHVNWRASVQDPICSKKILACVAKKGKEQSACDAHKTDDEWDETKCDGDPTNCDWQATQGSKTAT